MSLAARSGDHPHEVRVVVLVPTRFGQLLPDDHRVRRKVGNGSGVPGSLWSCGGERPREGRVPFERGGVLTLSRAYMADFLPSWWAAEQRNNVTVCTVL